MAKRALYSSAKLTENQKRIRDLAMADLKAFVALVAPGRVLGHCHRQMLDFFQLGEASHQLVLWPRAHQKSAMIAFWTVWYIINNPGTTILYASETAGLAEAQLSFMKAIMESDVVRRYWPELIVPDEGRRAMWRTNAIEVDHWARKENLVRDPTILAKGIGAGITGFHFDVLVLDDVVVYENSATHEERSKCRTWYSLVTSILNPGGIVKAVGTRYHPEDLYQNFIDMEEDIFDDDSGEVIARRNVWEVSQRVVEVDGEFLWPRTRRSDGAWFGYDRRVLSKVRAGYLNKMQFHAQYYNNPNDPEDVPISNFNYYDKDLLTEAYGRWTIHRIRAGKEDPIQLNVFAAIDFASTVSARSDYTAIVVVGVDCEHNVYVLDISRLKTDKISVMHDELTRMYEKWHWSKLRAEATAAQNLVVEQIKDFNRKNGIFYSIEIEKPTTQKELRMMSNLEPRYSAGMIYHYKGGNCELLEQELISKRPPHDDIKDALAAVMEILVAPGKRTRRRKKTVLPVHSKFGGIAWQ